MNITKESVFNSIWVVGLILFGLVGFIFIFQWQHEESQQAQEDEARQLDCLANEVVNTCIELAEQYWQEFDESQVRKDVVTFSGRACYAGSEKNCIRFVLAYQIGDEVPARILQAAAPYLVR